ncbi:UNVERIFIED_CONTAM: hypothetical protein FKN15_072693 [Acipenser sinensis]
MIDSHFATRGVRSGIMDRNALAELLQVLESRRDAEERRREECYTALIEPGERDWASGGNQREGREWTDRPRPTARQAQAEEEETADSHAAPPWISDLAALIRTVSTQAPHTRLCWNCGKPGHLQRRCPSAAAPPNCSSSENTKGPAPLPGSSTPLDSVSPSAVADGGPTLVRRPRPQRHRRLPGRFRDFALPRGRETKGGGGGCVMTQTIVSLQDLLSVPFVLSIFYVTCIVSGTGHA